jgi:hypothetical protein
MIALTLETLLLSLEHRQHPTCQVFVLLSTDKANNNDVALSQIIARISFKHANFIHLYDF